MSSRPRTVDPISREVIQNRLISVVREMSITVEQASYSPIIYEVKDFSSVLLRPNGDLVAEAEGIPSFLGAMPELLTPVLARYPVDVMQPQDVFISNDPYTANGTHKNDINVLKPIFWEGEIVFFAVNKAHWTDIGGKQPASWSPDATSTFQEGVCIPPVRLYAGGVLNEELLDTILANTRVPDDNRGDLMAQISACHTAERRVHAVVEQYGIEQVNACIDSLFDYVERRVRGEIEQLPDGEYCAEERVESDGVGGDPIPLRAKIVVDGSDVLFDFTGHETQRAGACGNINFVCLQAMCRVALKCLVAPHVPANHGMYRPVTVVATPGTVTNPQHPAPCTTWGDMGSGVQEAVFAALAPVLPDRVSAGIFGYGQTMAIAGPRTDTTDDYIHFMPYAGGWGGRSTKDGLSALCPLLNGDNYNMPCEVTEAEYPLRVERYELIRDSAGPGTFRGGLGVRTDYRVLSERAELSAAFNRYTTPPPGFFGGGNASLNALILDLGGPLEENRPNVSAGVVRRGAVVSHRTAGGGGFGEPRDRDPERIRADLADGYISPEAAARDYGYSLDAL